MNRFDRVVLPIISISGVIVSVCFLITFVHRRPDATSSVRCAHGMAVTSTTHRGHVTEIDAWCLPIAHLQGVTGP